ncbi:hypothetical protein QP866_02680 [Corynebacterium imitans]|uniref:hypothetical protein n=1 Tax=Corynebacterium imitans TaxID=156978 RepID=UPI00254F65F1|nr:hypothetical protein [Corynebacterium imitans]MDK8305803.1 hypothetical protein [Corynebacterium imitans]MDK8636731.1 hypothetical protein [Corynebacterium imitans]MDK8772346.1 hypothetical protein [Corynebacterium imitans]
MAPKMKHVGVAKRKRLILTTDIGLALALLAAVLQFFNNDLSMALWIGGGLLAAIGLVWLRQSIGGADLPGAELDEYETRRHVEARDDGLRGAIILSSALFAVAGCVALAARFSPEVSSIDVALFFAKLLYCQMVWIPFAVARSLAGKINRDELIA